MNMPGFTAKAALYRSCITYRSAYGAFRINASGAVIPAIEFSCIDLCILKFGICTGGCLSPPGPWSVPCFAACVYEDSKCSRACREGGSGDGQPHPIYCNTQSDCGPGQLCLGGECVTLSEPICRRQSDCPPDSLCREVRIVGSRREILGPCDSAQYYSGTPRSKTMARRPGDGGVQLPPLKECRCIAV